MCQVETSHSPVLVPVLFLCYVTVIFYHLFLLSMEIKDSKAV